MDSSPSPFIEEGDSIESSGQFIIRKLKSQLRAANTQIEHLKSDNFSMKEQNMKLKKYYDYMINYKTKSELLQQTNEQLNIQNQNLIKQIKKIEMEPKTMKQHHLNQDELYQNDYNDGNIYNRNPFDQSNKEMNMKIAKLIEQHKIEIELRDNIIRKLQAQNKQGKPMKIDLNDEELIKRNKNEINQEEIKQEIEDETNFIKMKEKYERIKKKCKKYCKTNQELENENSRLKNEMQTIKETAKKKEKEKETNAIRELIEKENMERKIRELEGLLAEERDKYYIYKEKATKYELELNELKHLISIVTNNENKLLELGVNKSDVFHEILENEGAIDDYYKKFNQTGNKKKK